MAHMELADFIQYVHTHDTVDAKETAYQIARLQIEQVDARAKQQRGDEWEFGLIEFHGQDALRERFYYVVNDLRQAACIVDLWLNDIQQTLKQFGYDMVIYKPKKEG